MPHVRRAQPWLGTIVSIATRGLALARAHSAIDAAFQQIAGVHRCMSFHDPKSDVSRINRAHPGTPIAVHPHTYRVLQHALQLSAATQGCFDITTAAQLVEWNLLPRPQPCPTPSGTWRDIELLPVDQVQSHRVVLHRPLWIDLGGIAKGFAVDRATQCLRAHGVRQSIVNAGGDIRVQGPQLEPIGLGVSSVTDTVPILHLSGGSVAGSSTPPQLSSRKGIRTAHVNGIQRTPVGSARFAAVLAPQCIVADALTKVVMALGADSTAILQQYNATAWLFQGSGWQHLGMDAMDAMDEIDEMDKTDKTDTVVAA